ncbi:hypothetical protein ACVW0Y_000177 [Pseudomonas sp. TE3786]
MLARTNAYVPLGFASLTPTYGFKLIRNDA